LVGRGLQIGGVSVVFMADLPICVPSTEIGQTDGFRSEGKGDRVAPRKERI
jgi:hypothetical protein